MDVCFKDLVEALTEYDKERCHMHLEPFEEYICTVQARFREDKDLFCSRLQNGYQVILNVLREDP